MKLLPALRVGSFAVTLVIATTMLAFPVGARQLETVRYISFTQPRLVAQGLDLGFFEREGILLGAGSARSSEEQLQQLKDMEIAIASANADNVVFWNEDHGADFFIFRVGAAVVDQNFYVRPEIQSIEDVRGKELAVDSAYSGYATLLRRILLRNGLVAERDYRFLPVGNTALRTAALIDGRAVGAMLSGLSPDGAAAGIHEIARGRDYAPLYPSGEFITTRRWVADNPHLLLAFIRSLITTQDWLTDPRNADEAIASIMRTDRVDAERAARIYATAIEDLAERGVEDQVRMDVVQSLVDLRAEVGLLPTPVPASRYVNPNWYTLALETMAMR